MESARFEIYPEQRGAGEHREPTGNYRWRFRAANSRIVAESGQGFGSRTDANRAIHDFISAIDNADCGIHPDIIDMDEDGTPMELPNG